MACITISDLNIQEWGLKESIKPATRPSLQIPTTTAPMWAGRRQLGLLTSSLALRFRKRSRQQWLKGQRTFSSQLLSFMHINTHSTHGKTRTREWHHSSSFLCHRSPILNNRRADYHAGSLHSVQKEKSTPNPPTHSGYVRRMKNYYFKATRSDSSSTMVTLTSKLVHQYFLLLFSFWASCAPLCFCHFVTETIVNWWLTVLSVFWGQRPETQLSIITFTSLRTSLRFGPN